MVPVLLADFNQMLEVINAKHVDEQENMQAFLSYIKCHEKCMAKWEEKENGYKNQLKTVKENEKTLTANLNNLETKFKHARRLIDQEKIHRKKAEEERQNMEQQLQWIRDLLHDNRNKLHDETRDKLMYLSNMDQRLSTINETFGNETTGSCWSDLSYSRSEDDLDIEMVRMPKKLRRSRAFAGDDAPAGPAGSPKRKCASRALSNHAVKNDLIRARPGESLVATTRVGFDNGVPTASSKIETIRSSVTSIIPPLEPKKPTAPQLSTDSGDSEFDNRHRHIIENGGNYRNKADVGMKDSKSAPVGSPSSGGFFQFGEVMSQRAHCLTNKTVIRPEPCDPCGKKIRFGRLAFKCSDCRTVCHIECKDKLRLPCIPPGCGTPTTKDNFGTIADYTPPTAPMVPAIVVHCINEIEERGLNEQGLYRVPGSDKEVKALKEKFLKGRGVPNLSLVRDIHVISGCLKDFLRSLREPLATYTQWPKFVDTIKMSDDLETRRAALYQHFTELPQPNRDTMAFLILHLQRVAEAKECMMPISSLAKIMGPTVIGYSRPDIEKVKLYIYEQSQQAVMVMEELLSIPAEYYTNFLGAHSTFHTPTMPCTPVPSTGSLHAFMESPLSSGWVTVRKKK